MNEYDKFLYLKSCGSGISYTVINEKNKRENGGDDNFLMVLLLKIGTF
jgi:hypothetical protein